MLDSGRYWSTEWAHGTLSHVYTVWNSNGTADWTNQYFVNGAIHHTNFDEENNRNWAYSTTEWDAAGEKQRALGVFDDGRSWETRFNLDDHSSLMTVRDAAGALIWQTEVSGSGRSWIHYWDHEDDGTWAELRREFNANGVLIAEKFVNDDGEGLATIYSGDESGVSLDGALGFEASAMSAGGTFITDVDLSDDEITLVGWRDVLVGVVIGILDIKPLNVDEALRLQVATNNTTVLSDFAIGMDPENNPEIGGKSYSDYPGQVTGPGIGVVGPRGTDLSDTPPSDPDTDPDSDDDSGDGDGDDGDSGDD